MTWPRPTTWRQGSILLPENFSALGLSKFVDFDFAIAISHSCDIANQNLEIEPNIEFIVGQIVSCDGNLSYAKNPRTLQLTALNNSKPITVEFSARNKITIPKNLLASHKPDDHFAIENNQLGILQSWLAARYNRHALPDSFNDRFTPIAKLLERLGKKNASGILGYYIDYQPRDDELTETQPYELWLYIVYSNDDLKFEIAAKEATRTIVKDFSKEIKKSELLGLIELVKCEAYSETEFTLSDTLDNVLYRFDHLSHKTDPPGPTL